MNENVFFEITVDGLIEETALEIIEFIETDVGFWFIDEIDCWKIDETKLLGSCKSQVDTADLVQAQASLAQYLLFFKENFSISISYKTQDSCSLEKLTYSYIK